MITQVCHPTQDYIVLCLDVGPSMDIAPPSGGDTHLEMALRVANQIVQQKVDHNVGWVAADVAHSSPEAHSNNGNVHILSLHTQVFVVRMSLSHALHRCLQEVRTMSV